MDKSRPLHLPRAIVRYRLAESPAAWPLVIGSPGSSHNQVVAGLRARYGRRLLEARPYQCTAPGRDAKPEVAA